jgi:hypothetical protein
VSDRVRHWAGMCGYWVVISGLAGYRVGISGRVRMGIYIYIYIT